MHATATSEPGNNRFFSTDTRPPAMLTSSATLPRPADFVIVGSGIAGASVGHWLAPFGKVVVLEREAQPGYHSTGRSAALYMASYGSPQVRALTLASRAFFDRPPAGFADHPLLSPRGALMVATHGQEAVLEQHWQVLQQLAGDARRLTASQACALVPVLRGDRVAGALLEPDAADMDVHAIHQGYLRGIRRHGGVVKGNAEVRALAHDGSQWRIESTAGAWRAPVVVNAAGAWADALAAMAGADPIGLVPCRRSALVFKPAPEVEFESWPMVYGAGEDWYFKPDAGQILASPANADPVPPQDVQPEELDIATAIHRIEEITTMQIRRPTRTWAGLRSFVADSGLVGGFDAKARGFFWVAAQGGYGIQTSAAMGEACASLVRGLPIPPRIADWGLTAGMLGPARLQPDQREGVTGA
jgi:D-arginine dehydrogenase